MKLTFLGAGAWGTALASHAATVHDVVLWGRDAAQLADIGANRDERGLPARRGVIPRLACEADFDAAVDHALADPDGLLVVATPVSGLREMTRRLAGRHAGRPGPLAMLWLCKGFEADTHAMPHQMVREELDALGVTPGQIEYGVLTGPSFAKEVAQGLAVRADRGGHVPCAG